MAARFKVCTRLWSDNTPAAEIPRVDVLLEDLPGYCCPSDVAISAAPVDGDLRREIGLMGYQIGRMMPYYVATAQGSWREHIGEVVVVNSNIAPPMGCELGLDRGHGNEKVCFEGGSPLSLYHLLFHVLRETLNRFPNTRSIALLGHHVTDPLTAAREAAEELKRYGRILPGRQLDAHEQIFHAVRDVIDQCPQAARVSQVYLLASQASGELRTHYEQRIVEYDLAA